MMNKKIVFYIVGLLVDLIIIYLLIISTTLLIKGYYFEEFLPFFYGDYTDNQLEKYIQILVQMGIFRIIVFVLHISFVFLFLKHVLFKSFLAIAVGAVVLEWGLFKVGVINFDFVFKYRSVYFIILGILLLMFTLLVVYIKYTRLPNWLNIPVVRSVNTKD